MFVDRGERMEVVVISRQKEWHPGVKAVGEKGVKGRYEDVCTMFTSTCTLFKWRCDEAVEELVVK